MPQFPRADDLDRTPCMFLKRAVWNVLDTPQNIAVSKISTASRRSSDTIFILRRARSRAFPRLFLSFPPRSRNFGLTPPCCYNVNSAFIAYRSSTWARQFLRKRRLLSRRRIGIPGKLKILTFAGPRPLSRHAMRLASYRTPRAPSQVCYGSRSGRHPWNIAPSTRSLLKTSNQIILNNSKPSASR